MLIISKSVHSITLYLLVNKLQVWVTVIVLMHHDRLDVQQNLSSVVAVPDDEVDIVEMELLDHLLEKNVISEEQIVILLDLCVVLAVSSISGLIQVPILSLIFG